MLLSLLLVFTAASASAETIDDLVLRNGSYYKKFSDTPYKGKISGEVNTSFTNGQLNGPWLKYHKNGQLFEKGTYETGKKTGFWQYYTKVGQEKTIAFWKEGIKIPDCITGTYSSEGRCFEKTMFYMGEFNLTGEYDGHGVEWDLRISRTYEGEWLDGKKNGQGTATYSTGSEYVGNWLDDKMHGQGTSTYADGDKYIGDWKDNKRHGQGTYTWANGNKYVGESKNDKIHGLGTYIWKSGRTFKGNWKDSRRHGQGTYTGWGKNKYVGEYKDGVRSGKGTQTDEKSTYVGDWKDGKKHGRGTLTKQNGPYEIVYVGQFKNGLKNGIGYEFSTGKRNSKKWESKKYNHGEWKDDLFIGE